MNRRTFIGRAGCAAMSYTTLMSSLTSLKSINLATASNSSVRSTADGYKALICLSLDGGNDSFNMLPPKGQSEHEEYSRVRGNLALSENEILNLNSLGNSGLTLGLHPSMPDIQALYNEGTVAFIANVGTLVEKVPDSEAFIYKRNKVPFGLGSHIDQLATWQTGSPSKRSPFGWGGLLADLVNDMNGSTEVSMSISLAGTNLFQTGEEIGQFTISNEGTGGLEIRGYNGESPLDQIKRSAIDNLLNHHYQDLFKKTYAETVVAAQNMNTSFGKAILAAPEFATQFSDTELSRDFRMVAKTISIQQNLDVSRQIFFINYGGWDSHNELLNGQKEGLQHVNNALAEFNQAMIELGLHQNVLTFTISDFGRTLLSNGNGTDHAWGGNVMVMGGPVKGQRIYGHYPELYLGNPLDLGGGVLIPTTSTDEYFAEIALWFGVLPSDLEILFPNIRNFFLPESGSRPLGFLN